MVMQSHLKEQEDQINGLKHELVMRTDAHVKKLWKLERALESLEDSMQKMTSMNESSTAQSQPYAKIIAKMNEEGRALDSALRALLDKLETSWTGPCLEKDEETAITPRSRLFQEKLWGHEPADILGISQQALDHCHKSMEQGNERSLADGSSYQHFAIAAKTLDKVHKQVAVLAKMYENAAANEAMWQTEAKQIQNQLGVVVKGHEKATARGNELQVDAQRAGERLDELLDVMSAAGINGREDLLLLVKRAEESVQLKKASPVLSLNREAKDKIKHFEHKWQEAAQEVENLKTTNRMILAERNGFEEQRRREYEAAEKNLRQVRGEREILKEMQQSHEGQRRLEHLLQESESSIRELEASLMMCQKSKLDTEAKRKDFERKWQESVHEGAKLKAVNSMLLTDISSLEKELSAVKADLNQTRTVNARLSMLAEDVERENRSYRAKGSTPGVPSSAGQATVDANPRSHIPPRTPRDSRNGTPRDLYREFLDDDRWSKLELAKKVHVARCECLECLCVCVFKYVRAWARGCLDARTCNFTRISPLTLPVPFHLPVCACSLTTRTFLDPSSCLRVPATKLAEIKAAR
jgi:chromosome segregation ATPase